MASVVQSVYRLSYTKITVSGKHKNPFFATTLMCGKERALNVNITLVDYEPANGHESSFFRSKVMEAYTEPANMRKNWGTKLLYPLAGQFWGPNFTSGKFCSPILPHVRWLRVCLSWFATPARDATWTYFIFVAKRTHTHTPIRTPSRKIMTIHFTPWLNIAALYYNHVRRRRRSKWQPGNYIWIYPL